ncbi:MAG TPA: DUF559 domain-containing protein [Acidimicrobiales bacterium]|nr:DUF559 domain-containing protein [Acidimicrobiales bacterium]
MAAVCDMRAIAERASEQLGLVTVDQLGNLDITRQTRRTLVRRGALVPLGPQVLLVSGHPPSWRQHLLAAVLEAGDGAVASHMAAAALWGFAGVRSGTVEVTVAYDRRPRGVTGALHRSRDLTAVDVGRHGPIPVTTPSRTLIDVAPRLGRRQIEDIVDQAARDGLIRLPYLRWRLEQLRRPGRPGVARILAVVPPDRPRRDEESWLERRTLDVLRDAGLPPPRCQARLRHGGGMARVDLLYEEARLVVEVDGHATHSTRRQRQADAERQARLVAAGWRVVRVTYEDVVERPDHVVAVVAELLGLAPGVAA